MSNQVARNYQPGNRYSPSKAEKDTLTLTPNVILAAPSQSFGFGGVSTNAFGKGIYLNQLNGSNVSASAGVTTYQTYQNAATTPFYTISANTGVKNGATLINSKIDNVLAINFVAGMKCFDGGASVLVAAAVSIVVFNADGTQAAQYAMAEYDLGPSQNITPPLANTVCQMRQCSAIVRVNAGQYAAVVISSDGPHDIRFQDKMANNGTGDVIVNRCILDIQKI